MGAARRPDGGTRARPGVGGRRAALRLRGGAAGDGLPLLYDVRVRRIAVEQASAGWALATAPHLKAAGKIRVDMTKTEVAAVLADELMKAARAGALRRALKASYIENQLAPGNLAARILEVARAHGRSTKCFWHMLLAGGDPPTRRTSSTSHT